MFFSIVLDTVFYNAPYIAVAFFYLGLIKHKGSFSKAIEDVKN